MASNRGLAAWLDYYRAPLRDALERSRADGYQVVTPNTVSADLDPALLGHTGRRHLLNHLQSLGLGFAGLATEFPGMGLTDSAHAEQRLRHLRTSLEMARDLGVRRASVKIGGFGDPRSLPLAVELLSGAADLSDRTGVTLSVHGSSRDAESLLQKVNELDCPTIRFTLDSAALAANPELIQSAMRRIGEIHLRDGRSHGEQFEETSFGRGDVDFVGLLAMAESADHEPLRVVRRDTPGNVDALRQGREYIEALLHSAASRGARPA